MTKDPYLLSASEFEREVRAAVSDGAFTPSDATRRIKDHFSPQPLVWVEEKGEHQLSILVQQHAGTGNVNIVCER